MQFIIHRGAKEIGGSCVEVFTDRTRVLLDFGIPLVDKKGDPLEQKQFVRKPTAELINDGILPKVEGLYEDIGTGKRIDAILLSHPHLDHYGFISRARKDIPIYLSRGTAKILLASEIYLSIKLGRRIFKVQEVGKHDQIGDIELDNYLMDHSGFDARAFLLENGGNRLFYTGDFRGHGRKKAAFEMLLNKPPLNIDCLLMEGTSIDRDDGKMLDENAIEEEIVQTLRENHPLTFFNASSQNIDRFVSLYRACIRTDTTLVIDLYTAFVLHKLAYMKDIKPLPQYSSKIIRVLYLPKHAETLAESGYRGLLYKYRPKKINPNELGKSGRMLVFLKSPQTLSYFKKKGMIDPAGSTFIFSMYSGYLKEGFKKAYTANGITTKHIHTSGHASIADLKRLVAALKPKTTVPIHTFAPDKYSGLFGNLTTVHQVDDSVVYNVSL